MHGIHAFFLALLCGLSIALPALPAHAAILKVGTCGDCTYATISAAVADSVGGDRIEVYPGVYNETVNLNTMKIKGSIALMAMGATTIHSVPGEPGITYDMADAGDTNFPGNISIEGFDITSDSSAIELVGTTGNVSILECTASSVIGTGIFGENIIGNVTINKCTADNTQGIGVWLQAVFGNVSMNGCTTNNVQAIGTYLIAIFGDTTLKNHTSNDCQPYGIYMNGINGDATLENCNANNNDYGIVLQSLSTDRTCMVRCSNMTGNRACGLLLSSGNFDVEAVNNWWGDASGPTHTGNPGGGGDAICEEDGVNKYTGTVTFDSWLGGPFELIPRCSTVPVPTLNQWGLIVLAVSMAGAAVRAGRRAGGKSALNS